MRRAQFVSFGRDPFICFQLSLLALMHILFGIKLMLAY